MKLKILGPPGTGKTTRLLELLEDEITQGTNPKKIGFLTFTRAAREEALRRTKKSEAEFPYLRTIHSICYRQMGVSNYQMIKHKDLRAFGKELNIKVSGNLTDPWIEDQDENFDPVTQFDLLLQMNHYGRHKGILLKEALQKSTLEVDYKYATWFTKAYRTWKRDCGMIDYTDLLTYYLERGSPLDIDVMFVDEAQDLSPLQWDVVGKLGANAKRWYIAGDDDQAIFTWAGAASDAFQDLHCDETEILRQSHRVSKAIHEVAMTIAHRIEKRIPKEYAPTESEGEFANSSYLRVLDFDQKTFILFRNHYRGLVISNALKEDFIPYIGYGSPLCHHDVRVALQSWRALFKNGNISAPAAKILTRFCDSDYLTGDYKDKLKKQRELTIDDIFLRHPEYGEWTQILVDLPQKPLIEGFVQSVGFKNTAHPKIELMSIHQSKGREAHTVVLDTDMSKAVYDSMLWEPDEEHRVWYVGVTRAKERLFTLLPEGMYFYGI